MLINRLLILGFMLAPMFIAAQNKLSGFIKDAETGELLIGATIQEPGTSKGTASNNHGYFSLITEMNTVSVSYIGYQSQQLSFNDNDVVTVQLLPGEELEEVVVLGQHFETFNQASLSAKELMQIPAIGGKPDILKTLQLMPGIQSQAEGTSLINVRGGNPGENLYLIDNVPLSYVNHLGGFLSVFNPDMINNMEVYKGGFPAKYGGKLSSVMAITQREGNKKKWKGNLGIGVTDASFAVEGPLLKNKGSLIVTGRKTLIDALFLAYTGLTDNNDFLMFYGFHDINAKFTYRPDEKNSYHLNFYQGDDYLKFWNKRDQLGEKGIVTNSWGNWLLSGRWNRVISPRLYVSNMVSATRYRLKVATDFTSYTQSDSVDFQSKYLSSVADVTLRSDWNFQIMKNYSLEFGAKVARLTHVPNFMKQSGSALEYTEEIHSFENNLYAENQFTLFNRVDANLGLHLVQFINDGLNFIRLEPRISINARVSDLHTLNVTCQNVNQFSHLLFTSGVILNNEIWVPADQNIAPSNSEQYSVGWKGNFANRMLSAELNLYYKTMSNLATYKEGYSNLLGDGSWRTKIETGGQGSSKGVEFLLRKQQGNWTGFAAYTYSKTTRQFEGINRGEEYVFDFDRPHSGAISISRKLSDKWDASATWVYQTGLPYTPVLGRHSFLDPEWGLQEGLIYGERNSKRMNDYHRMDVGFTQKRVTKRGRRALLTLSIYNVYNRQNPNAYYYDVDNSMEDMERRAYKPLKLYQVSFFPIIPSISWKVFFE